MASSTDLYNQMQGLVKQYDTYTPINSGDVYADLSNRVGNFRPQYQELAGQEAKAYAAPGQLMGQYYNQYNQNPGGGGDPFGMLSSILGQTGREYGTADVMRGVLDSQRGNLQNMAQDVLGQYNAVKSGFMDKYNMLSPLYNSQLGIEEAQRGRDFQAQQASLDRANQLRAAHAGAGGWGDFPMPGEQKLNYDPSNYTRQIQDGYVQLARERDPRKRVQLASRLKSMIQYSTYAQPGATPDQMMQGQNLFKKFSSVGHRAGQIYT